MRSSKSRSRSKANRPRTLGNIINRVFDSSGPEGKVRGTPQQIIEKYQQLARDAQLSNDRVAAENFSQHAEHYTRMLAEAMREMAAEQEARQVQFGQQGGQPGGQQGGQGGQQGGQGQNGNRDRQDYRDRSNEPRGDRGNDPRGERPNDQRGERSYDRDRPAERTVDRNGDRPNDRPERSVERQDRGDYRSEYRGDDRERRDFGSEEQPAEVEVIDLGGGDDTGLIETPEARNQDAPAADAAPREERTRRPRGPRKPKPAAGGDDAPPKEAAE
ncbi:DUF4167 domain-containing protein [Tabrizicola sp. BL-A-41-H6]|uniref:DUF4167 domain-containing protein n=1 Tax=Tabrizicola sp. BL-A-41-H6 TaxID=3421107 RepID=UPI003D6773AF